jgi:pimeloyl-ACP methyl ester carboxylesterase
MADPALPDARRLLERDRELGQLAERIGAAMMMVRRQAALSVPGDGVMARRHFRATAGVLRARNRAVARRMLAAVLVMSVVGGCGGDDSVQPGGSRTTTHDPLHALDAGPGRLVAIGAGRSLFLKCAGSGGPAVILEAGGPGYARQWQDVQPQLARSTQVCSYDRAGAGQSLPTHGVRDARDESSDLWRLLARARIEPPYVLVGHSYGGVLARVFARRHPVETAGLVLVDTMGRDGRRRQLAVWPHSQAPVLRDNLATTVINDVDLSVGEALASRLRTVRATPLAVIDAARQKNFAQNPPRLRRRLLRLWVRMHDELAALSDNSVHVSALRSDHDVASSVVGQPSVVIRAVRAVVRAVQDGTRLAPCPRIFSGPDVRCHRAL